LTEGLDIRLNTAVKKIKYYDGGVEVTAENLKTNNSSVLYKGKSFNSFNPILGG
jgi:lysine-specific histone demethylase 1